MAQMLYNYAMATWASVRKTKYAIAAIIFLILIIGIPAFLFFYERPDCFDRIMNGDETGVDCGGICKRLCQSAFLPPKIEWGGPKMEKVGEGLYNVAAYIVNPNINGGAVDVPYRVTLYDESGSVIGGRDSKVNLYPHRNSLAFQAQVKATGLPSRATFEFLKSPEWFKSDDTLTNISIVEKKYEEEEKTSSLNVILQNKGLYVYKNILVGVVLYDSAGNVTGFSQTEVDTIAPNNGKETAPFTWPITRNGKVISQDVILSTKPLLSNK